MMLLRSKPAKARQNRSQVRSYSINDREFAAISKLIKEKTGINLSEKKRDLVVSRLARRLRQLDLDGFSSYLALLDRDKQGSELIEFINSITTNKTDFFREKHHFDFLTNEIFPQILQDGAKRVQRTIRIWSAACSSGEEPYSIAMTAAEFFRDKPDWKVKILATDLDTNMLTKAQQGVYAAGLLDPVPKQMKQKYFDAIKDPGEPRYQVKPGLRKMVTFKKFNLMTPRYPSRILFEFIFCRNVMIYFDPQDKIDILTKLHSVLIPDGHIFVGHSESLMMVRHLFKYAGTTIYSKA